MTPVPERRLVSIRRSVTLEERPSYDDAWAVLHEAATGRGAHAWRFASADVPELYLEFLEFGLEGDLREDHPTLAAIQTLHETFGGAYPVPRTLEEWVEIPTEPRP